MPVDHSQSPIPTEAESRHGCLPALVRLIWIFGAILLVYVALFIAQRKGGILPELGLFVLAALIIFVRYLDIRYLKGETMDNKPATLKDWRRYAVKMAVAAAALYAAGKFLATKNLF